MRSKSGVTQIALGIVIGLIFLAVVLPIGLSVWQATTGAVFTAPTGASSTIYNTSYAINTNANTNIGSGFSLLAIAPLVLAAGGIIGLLVVAFTRFRGS